jgi:hypothetical protein
VKFDTASERVELRRELNQKMQLTLDHSEEMWQEKNATLVKEVEQVSSQEWGIAAVLYSTMKTPKLLARICVRHLSKHS